MSKSNVVAFSGLGAIADPLTELLRRGARALIQQAAEAELSEEKRNAASIAAR